MGSVEPIRKLHSKRFIHTFQPLLHIVKETDPSFPEAFDLSFCAFLRPQRQAGDPRPKTWIRGVSSSQCRMEDRWVDNRPPLHPHSVEWFRDVVPVVRNYDAVQLLHRQKELALILWHTFF